MKKKNKKKDEPKESKSFLQDLSSEVKHGALALLFLAIAIFFTLSPMHLAGVAGDTMYGWLYTFFGVGYFMIPILSLMFASSYLKETRPELPGRTTVGALVFLVSGLGLIGVMFGKEASGMFGDFIAGPMTSAFGSVMAFIFLLVLVLISLFIFFNSRPKNESLLFWRNLFKKKGDDTPVPADIDNLIVNNSSEEPAPELKEAPASADAPKQPKQVSKSDKKQEAPGDKLKDVFGLGRSKAQTFLDLHVGEMPFNPPPLKLLSGDSGKPEVGDIKAKANQIKRTLSNFGIEVEMDQISVGPTVTRYSLKPAEGVRLSRIVTLQDNLALALAAPTVRIEAPIPGKSLVGIEVPNTVKAQVGLGTLLKQDEYQQSAKPLYVAVGKDIGGKPVYSDLAKMPHLLIAGTTGSGKSVTCHALIASMIYRNPPESLQFIMVDPKRVELTLYKDIPHLLTPVITDPKGAIKALMWAVDEMQRRYDILQTEHVRDISSYHENVYKPAMEAFKEKSKKVKIVTDGSDPDEAEAQEKSQLPPRMPYIVFIIDELADIMHQYPRELEAGIVRLAQMSRAVGIHLILSTQRPSVDVITGLIKANIPSRMALRVSSQIDSRTILDVVGAEKLLGQGDLLYKSGDMAKPKRVQSAYIPENEIKDIVKYLKKQYEGYLPNEINLDEVGKDHNTFGADIGGSSFGGDKDDEDDEIYDLARQTVIESGKASTSFLQRRLKLGYSRAARIVDLLEERGVIGPQNGSKPRDVYPDGDSDVPDDLGSVPENDMNSDLIDDSFNDDDQYRA